MFFKIKPPKPIETIKEELYIDDFIKTHQGTDQLSSIERLSLTLNILKATKRLIKGDPYYDSITTKMNDKKDFRVVWKSTEFTEQTKTAGHTAYRVSPTKALLAEGYHDHAHWVRSVGCMILQLWSTYNHALSELMRSEDDKSIIMIHDILFANFLNGITDLSPDLAPQLKTFLEIMLTSQYGSYQPEILADEDAASQFWDKAI